MRESLKGGKKGGREANSEKTEVHSLSTAGIKDCKESGRIKAGEDDDDRLKTSICVYCPPPPPALAPLLTVQSGAFPPSPARGKPLLVPGSPATRLAARESRSFFIII